VQSLPRVGAASIDTRKPPRGCPYEERLVEVFELAGLLDEALTFGQDTDWVNRARTNGVKIDTLQEVIQLHRRHEGNMTKAKSFKRLNGFEVVRPALQRRKRQQAPQREG